MDEEGSVPGRGIAQNPVFMVIPSWSSLHGHPNVEITMRHKSLV